MNDNMAAAKKYGREPAPPETWIIGRSAKSVAWALLSYALKHAIPVNDVGYSLVYDDSKEEKQCKN